MFNDPTLGKPEGNIFVMVGRARALLKSWGCHDDAKKMTEEISQARSHKDALAILAEYGFRFDE